MSQILRSWLAFAAIGAAVIHLALVISSPLPLGVALALLGAVEFAWGILTLSRDRIVSPKAARFGALVPLITWSLFVVAATVLDDPALACLVNCFPMAVATLFELFIAIAISLQLRRERPVGTPTGTGRYLLGMFAGALLVATITAPALASTQAGLANPHTSHYFDTSGHAGH